MISNTVGILGGAGCGGSFLDWSILYLSGAEESLAIQYNDDLTAIEHTKVLPIVENPLNPLRKNAHIHNKNHPVLQTLDATMLTLLESSIPLATVFCTAIAAHDEKYQNDTGATSIIYDIAKKYRNVNFIAYNYIEADYEKLFFSKFTKVRPAMLTMLDRSWSDEPWEVREKLALFFPSAIRSEFSIEHQIQNNVLLCSFDNIANNQMLSEIKKIFAWLDLEIDPLRIEHWEKMYRQWFDYSGFKFFNDIDHIMYNIMHGVDYDLSKYNMSFGHEIVLLSRILFDYNMSLKADGIEVMPLNTRDWNTLLEENTFHDLDGYRPHTKDVT